jgi:hypothetical protein
MNVAISQEGNLDILRSTWIQEVSNELQREFEKQNFGKTLKSLIIGIVCVKPEFDFFFKEKKPKYYSGKRVITHDGISIEVENALEYNLKLDYSQFSLLDEKEFKNALAKEILISIDIIPSIKKLNDFNFKSFQEFFSSILNMSGR